MNDDFTIPWDRMTCRKIIDYLRDGKPPPSEAIEFLSVGYEDHLARAKAGLEKARAGGYDIMILEGRYGIGKSHLLGLIETIAEQQDFVVKRVEVGTGRVYFNSPPQLHRQILCGEAEPWSSEYSRYGPFYGDQIRRFMAGLKILAERHRRRGKAGLVILLDELENTFSSRNLPNFRSRAKAYRVLNALFKGGVEDGYQYVWQTGFKLAQTYVVLAITPGTIERAVHDGPVWGYNYENPAEGWVLPLRREINPLSFVQALELAQRIRAVHSRAFNWEANKHVGNAALKRPCQNWLSQGASRDERQLVKQVVETLELAEQNH